MKIKITSRQSKLLKFVRNDITISVIFGRTCNDEIQSSNHSLCFIIGELGIRGKFANFIQLNKQPKPVKWNRKLQILRTYI